MFEFIPKSTPPLELMLNDIGGPKAKKLAKAMGVTERTAQRWITDNQAPRAVALALYWVTRWGRSEVDCAAVNEARNAAGMIRALSSENQALKAQIARLGRIGDFGSANDPAPDVRGSVPSPGLQSSPWHAAAQPLPELQFPPIEFPAEASSTKASESMPLDQAHAG